MPDALRHISRSSLWKRLLSTFGMLMCVSGAPLFGQPTPPGGILQPPVERQKSSMDALLELVRSYPFCICVDEDFANQFVRTENRDDGPVRDFVLGANVVGTQQTTARTALDFVYNQDAARMLLLLEGITNNQTTSYTPQAAIQSEGSYRFQLSKQIDFDGYVLKTRSPAAWLTINQRNRGAMTPVSTIPVIGPLANMAALYAADQRRPIAEKIAAMRVTDQVGPRFNNEVDQQLGCLNKTLAEQIRPKLTEWNILPAEIRTFTTNDVFHLALRAEGEQRSLPPPKSVPVGGTGVRLFVHESAINDLVQKAPLAGLELPDTALTRLQNPAGADSQEPAVPKLATIILAQDRPVTTTFSDGAIQIQIRVSFRPVLGPVVPMQVVTVSLVPALNGPNVTVTSRLDGIKPAEPTPGDTVSTIAGTVIRQQLEQQLKEMTFPRTFQVPGGDACASVPLELMHLSIEEEWLIVELKAKPATTGEPSNVTPPNQEFAPPVLKGPALR